MRDTENDQKNRPYDSYSGVRRLSMAWDDTATDMKEVRAADGQDTEGRIFDLGGRQVKNPSRGIFVINGKKVKK